MSGADYFHCPVCSKKALYDGNEDDTPGVVVFHDDCIPKLIADQTDRVRENIARDIEAEMRHQVDALGMGPHIARRYEHAAAIARGSGAGQPPAETQGGTP